MKLSENALKQFKDLYSFQEEDIKDTFKRVMSEFVDKKENKELYDYGYNLLVDGVWRPNTPTWLNAGTNHKIFSACYVVDLQDSMNSIYDVANTARKIFQFGSGVGIPIGNLREKNAFIYEENPEVIPEGKSCLTGDTILLNNKDNLSVKNQKVNIKWLYEYYQNVKNPKYRVRSMLDDFGIGINIIEDVIYNGKRPIYKIETKDGYNIKATGNHRFLAEDGTWKKLEDFSIKDKIGVNGKIRKVDKCKRCGKVRLLRGSKSKYSGLCENCVVSVFNGCSLNGSKEEFEKRSKAIKEYRNKKEVKEYYSVINSGENNPMWRGKYANETTARARNKNIYLWNRENHVCERCGETEKRIEVHHRDGNPYNNEINNLEVLCIQCHNDEHKKRRAKGNYRLTKEVYFDEIVNIEYIGIDDVYDIKMKEPYHNFIANGFVSHNSGPITFMKLFDAVGETTKSGGRVRRAAILCNMPINHPDNDDFIECKESDGRLSNMNISLSINDDFMQALKDGVNYDLISPYENKKVGEKSAEETWNKLVGMAWKTADPGVIFIDTVNKYNPLRKKFEIKCCNPCGEQFLPPFSCCNLSAINVSKFIHNDAYFDFDKLYEVSFNVMEMMDNIIDTMDYPDQRFKDNTLKYRQVGIGIMGLADAMYKLDLRYNGIEGRKFAGDIMRVITTACAHKSALLARDKGTFYEYNKFKDDIEKIVAEHIGLISNQPGVIPSTVSVMDMIKEHGLRNSQFTTCMPTGTTALSCDASYGMEPCMGLSFQKNYIDGTKAIILNHIFEEKFNKEDWYTDNLPERIFNNGGSLKGLRGIPDEVRKVFVVAHDIGYKERIDMQSEIQKYTSNGISSTINLPMDATVDDISYIYKYAYEKNLKGVTIYRDGSKRNQPVTFTEEVKEEKFVRPNKLLGNVYKVETGNGRMYVTIGEYHGKPVEVFIQIGKSGQIMNTFSEALGRIISLALQNGVPVDEVTEKLSGINSDKSVWFRFDEADKKPSQILSAPDGLAQLLNRYYSGKQYEQELTGEICEKCGSNMTMVEGCVTCNNCGNSKCS